MNQEFGPPLHSNPTPKCMGGGVCHGSLGELFQGVYFQQDGTPNIAIISFSVNLFSYAYFSYDEAFPYDEACNNILDTKPKSHQTIQSYLDFYGLSLPNGKWFYHSDLIQGCGMSSSTADIVASIRCLDSIFQNNSPPKLISEILYGIERSDCVFVDGYNLYLSDKQEIIESFGSINSPIWCCYINENTPIDTENMYQTLLKYYQTHKSQYADILYNIRQAFRNSDIKSICKLSSKSAELSQNIVPKANYFSMVKNQNNFCADGIFVAHTGSIIGYLFTSKPSPKTMGELVKYFISMGYICKFSNSRV